MHVNPIHLLVISASINGVAAALGWVTTALTAGAAVADVITL